jgi:hypothetical protein
MANISVKKILIRLRNIVKNLLNMSNIKGAVLIEFSFAVPLLVIVMYFALDVPQFYRLSAKLQQTSELYAQMLLNMVNARASKTLTIDDLINTSKAIGLTFTGIAKSTQCPFYLSTYIMCIQGDNTTMGKFKINWCVHVENDLNNNEVTSETGEQKTAYKYSSLQNGSTQLQGSISDFVIYQGELKLLIETVVWYIGETTRGFNKYFHMISIPGKSVNGGAKCLGDKFTVITPLNGMISKDIPKQQGA